VGKAEGQSLLERPKLRREDNIERDIKEIGWEAWIGLIWLRLTTSGGLLFAR
jgi:hypothetical protein